jgi:hypothetical protein
MTYCSARFFYSGTGCKQKYSHRAKDNFLKMIQSITPNPQLYKTYHKSDNTLEQLPG